MEISLLNKYLKDNYPGCEYFKINHDFNNSLDIIGLILDVSNNDLIFLTFINKDDLYDHLFHCLNNLSNQIEDLYDANDDLLTLKFNDIIAKHHHLNIKVDILYEYEIKDEVLEKLNRYEYGDSIIKYRIKKV